MNVFILIFSFIFFVIIHPLPRTPESPAFQGGDEWVYKIPFARVGSKAPPAQSPAIRISGVRGLLFANEGLNRPPLLSTDKSQQQPDRQFKKAVNLANKGFYREAENILLGFVADSHWHETACFLLGRIYKEQGYLDRAEDYLKKAAVQHFLLKGYTLKTLVDIYITEEKFDRAVETSRLIQNKALLKEARQSEIKALLALKKDGEAIRVLYQYLNKYREEWDSKLVLARLLKSTGKREEAVRFLKDIYVNATDLSEDALGELKTLNADTFSQKELLRRAKNLFLKGSFQEAETAYRDVLKDIDDSAIREKVKFAIGMCQFRQKKYHIAAKSFGLIKSPEAMYWMAKSFYRVDNMDGFNMVIKAFEKEYPADKYLAELYLILADEKRRTGKLSGAEAIFKKVLNDFPENAEDVLWGLGWMNYTNGDYEEAVGYFSKLTSSLKSRERYKYIYWEAKSREMLAKACIKQAANLRMKESVCSEKDKGNNAYSRLSGDTGYYGFLAKIRFRGIKPPEKIEIVRPEIPKGRVYERIETLKFLGMNKEVADEIKLLLKSTKSLLRFKYLGYTAIDVGEYKSILYLTEEKKSKEFLLLAYPLGYWDVVKKVAESKAVDAYLITALIREESRFDPKAVSMAGAVGLMQLMPFTAHRVKKDLKLELRDDSELYDIEKNISLGTHYISLLIREFKEIPLAVAAYNAGEEALKEWLIKSNHKDIEEFIEDIPYRETRRYVKNVLRSYWQYRTIEGLPLRGDKG